MKATIAATLMPANQNSNHQDQRAEPQRDVDPVLDDLRARDGLEADDDHPEVPVQPPDREPGPVAHCGSGVVGEGPGRRVGHGHLGQHPHHHDDQHAGKTVGDERARPGVADDDARADEQAGADHAADGDHRQLPLAQRLLQCGCCAHCILRCSMRQIDRSGNGVG
jgi:hypothetical protein